MARRRLNRIEVREHGALATHPLDGLVRGLAALETRPDRIVSLYLDARWDDEQQRERARIELKTGLADLRHVLERTPPAARDALARDLARAEAYATDVIRQRVDVGFEGIAAFYCEARRVELVLLSHAAVPTRLRVGTRPDLGPLARSAHAIDLALVAIVETDETRILELTMGGATEDTIPGDVPARVVRGGWRQLRIQKHIADHIRHHHTEAGRDLTARFDGVAGLRGRPPRVVIGGREPILSAFERTLPERVLAGAVRAPELDPQAPIDQVLALVRRALAESLAHENRELVVQARNAAATGRGALGTEGVVALVNEGRLRDLLVDGRFHASGVLCTRCDLLSDRPNPACAACGGEVEEVELEEELIRRAVLAGATVHTLAGAAGAADADDPRPPQVAALARY